MKEINTKSIKKFGLVTGAIMLAGVGIFSIIQKNNANVSTEVISTVTTVASPVVDEITSSSSHTSEVSSSSTATSMTSITSTSLVSSSDSTTGVTTDLLISLPKDTTNTVYQYKIKEGDMFWCLAEKYYGSAYNWVDLMNANNFSDEKQYYLYVDEVVSFPEVSEVQSFEKTNFCK